MQAVKASTSNFLDNVLAQFQISDGSDEADLLTDERCNNDGAASVVLVTRFTKTITPIFAAGCQALASVDIFSVLNGICWTVENLGKAITIVAESFNDVCGVLDGAVNAAEIGSKILYSKHQISYP